jgi:transposase-like protein
VPRHTPPYPEEFRREAVRLAKLGGKPQWKLAKELGITAVTLRKWLRQDKADEEARREAEVRAPLRGRGERSVQRSRPSGPAARFGGGRSPATGSDRLVA